MTKLILAAAIAAALATPASAQVGREPFAGTGDQTVPQGGVLTPQTNATGDRGAASYSPTGRAEDVISNDSAAAGNAGQPSRVAPQGGGGGGGR